MNNIKTKYGLLVLSLLLSYPFFSQTLSERRIYYLDVTASMEGYNGNPNIWREVTDNLITAINSIKNPNTEFAVVTFTDSRHPLSLVGGSFFHATDSEKQRIIKCIKALDTRKDYTDIYVTFNDFYNKYVGDADLTYCFIMTDGLQSPRNGGIAKWENAISLWNQETQNCGKYTYGFYVMLTDAAKNVETKSVIDRCTNLWQVESADVNINMIRLQDAICKFRECNYADVYYNGDLSECTIECEGNSKNYRIGRIEPKLEENFVRIHIEKNENSSILPLEESINVGISLKNKGALDFLLTNSINIKCLYRGSMEIKPTFNKKEKNIENLGEMTYYPRFLWSKGKDDILIDSLYINYNHYAIAQNGFCEFEFTDKKGKIISDKEVEIFVDGKKLSNSRFSISAPKDFVEVRFHFLPNANKGYHKGFLRLTENHNLDKDGETVLKDHESNNSLVWQIRYKKPLNPLAKICLWIGILIVSCLLLWFLLIRPIKYPCFKKFRKSVIVLRGGQIIYNKTCQFKGARMVVFSYTKEKQSMLNRFFTGRIVSFVDASFTNKVVFIPKKKGKAAFVRGIGYSITPNPIPRSGVATISNNQLQIKLN